MIKEKKVLIGVGGKNKKHFEDMGYIIPKKIDDNGRVTTRGVKIWVKIEHLSKRSGIKVTKVCDICDTEIPNAAYSDIVSKRETTDGKDRCFTCSVEYRNNLRFGSVDYENSLKNYALENNDLLIKEFSQKNQLKIDELYKTSNKMVIWKCEKCFSEYKMKVSSRTYRNGGCPYCNNLRVNHTNNLHKTHSKIADLLEDREKGYEVTYGSNKKLSFKCPNCNLIEERKVRDVVKYGFRCRGCSDGVSYPEKFMLNLLKALNVNFKREKSFSWSMGRRYDFYIKENNMIIEVHGEQHFNSKKCSYRGRTYLEEVENDKLKKKIAKENGIEHYIVIDARLSKKNFIQNSVLQSKLSSFYNFTDIDWHLIDLHASNSMIKKASELWESNQDIMEICREMNLSHPTILKYLKQGSSNGWCSYDSRQERVKPTFIKPIMQLTLDGDLIREWSSIKEACDSLGISNDHVIATCKGRRDSFKGYKWSYKNSQ